MTVFFWIAVTFGVCAIACAIDEWDAKRQERRRIQRLNERRQYLDNVEPRRWTT
jgi:hypothetical protein